MRDTARIAVLSLEKRMALNVVIAVAKGKPRAIDDTAICA